jgi:hypothetical protein
MPIELRVMGSARLVVGSVRGTVDISEMLEALDRARADPDFGPAFDVLSDHREVDTPLTPRQLEALLGHFSTLGDAFVGSRWAIVTAAPASYGMMRMLSARAEPLGLEVTVFREMDEARAWLGLGPDAPTP